MAWNTKYRMEWTDDNGLDWKVLFKREDYAGAIIEMVASEDPMVIEWLTLTDKIFGYPIKGSVATFNAECYVNFAYLDLRSDIELFTKVEVYCGEEDDLFWLGWVNSDYIEPYDVVPYTVSIKATDGLGKLKTIAFKDGVGDDYEGRETEATILINVLSKIGFDEFNEFINIYEDRMDDASGDSVCDQLDIQQDLFLDKKCYEVVHEIALKYTSFLRQWMGEVFMYRPVELLSDLVYGRNISISSTSGIELYPDQYLERDRFNSSGIMDTPGGMLMFSGAINKMTANMNFGNRDSWILNPNFDADTWNDTSKIYDKWSFVGSPIWHDSVGNAFPGVATDGIIMYAGTVCPSQGAYVYQDFATNAKACSNDFIFEFQFRTINATGSTISNAKVYTSVESLVSGASLNDQSDGTAVWEGGVHYFDTIVDAPVGFSDIHTFSVTFPGLPAAGPYRVKLFSSDNNVVLYYRAINFYSSSPEVSKLYTVNVNNPYGYWYNPGSGALYPIGGSGGPVYVSNNVKYSTGKLVNDTYEVENENSGEDESISPQISDCTKSDLRNTLQQFNASMSIVITGSLNETAATFAAENYDNYHDVGVLIQNIDKVLRFTAIVPGTAFSGSTTIANVTTNLNGSVEHVQANVVATKRKERVTVSGSMGSGHLSFTSATGSIGDDITYNSSPTQTAADFVSANATAWAAEGFNLTSSSIYIYVELNEGTEQIGEYEQYDANLVCTIEEYTEYTDAQAQIDEISLTGISGTANITCSGETNLATFESGDINEYTRTWHTRGGSEEKPIIELIIDEIAALYESGKQFLQLNILETTKELSFNVIGNVIDPTNITEDSYLRIFAINRAIFNGKSRSWMVDLLEIGSRNTLASWDSGSLDAELTGAGIEIEDEYQPAIYEPMNEISYGIQISGSEEVFEWNLYEDDVLIFTSTDADKVVMPGSASAWYYYTFTGIDVKAGSVYRVELTHFISDATTTTTTTSTTTEGYDYDAHYLTMLGVFNTAPTMEESIIEDTMLSSLNPLWDKIKAIYILAGHSDDDSLWNWKNPAGDCNATKHGTPAWTKYEGYTGDGGTNYIHTNFNPSVDGDGMASDDTCILWGIGTDVMENYYDVLAGTGTVCNLSARSRAAVSSGYLRQYCNDTTLEAIANTNAIKHYALSRGINESYDAYINSSKTNKVVQSTGLCNFEINLITGTKQMRYFIIGLYLTESEVATVRNAMETYLDSYGKGLI